MDRNDYYGGPSASLNLEQLFAKFAAGKEAPSVYGRSRDWYIDLVPKFILSRGKLVDVLRHTDVNKYLKFKVVNGSYVLHPKDRRICKVPSTTKEVIGSKLLKISQKNKLRKLLEFIAGMHDNTKGYDLKVMKMKDLFAAYKIDKEVQNFMGHAMALWLNDDYLERPAYETCFRIHQYCRSVASYGQSPYIYPLYGLGELPQAFARLSSIWGGTYMLRMPIEEILFNEDGTVHGVRSNGENAYCKWLIGDPSYFEDFVETAGKVSRGICLLEKPLDECVAQVKTKTSSIPTSAQIIISADLVGRKNDIYVTTQGSGHKTAPMGLEKPYCLGFVSTISEAPGAEENLRAGFDVLGRAGIREKFVYETDLCRPRPGTERKNIFISESYDATSHFDTTVNDVLALFYAITGKEVDVKAPPRKPVVWEAGAPPPE
eukprot:gnl/Chilomastix_cuspidata/415.p1 GENE.gnl/Chilomastix_cuspidata/415~~gnl/Chilomastix_cuspidata/415.p1  ORF type:complete len:473 (-),score=179.07 gnl/Chilomastix_cuspidata/415:584-1876(-)